MLPCKYLKSCIMCSNSALKCHNIIKICLRSLRGFRLWIRYDICISSVRTIIRGRRILNCCITTRVNQNLRTTYTFELGLIDDICLTVPASATFAATFCSSILLLGIFYFSWPLDRNVCRISPNTMGTNKQHQGDPDFYKTRTKQPWWEFKNAK